MNTPTFIAEVKTKSPFGFQSNHSYDELFDIANEYGDILSIHTDPRWGGSMKRIKEAKSKTNKPILAKGLHVENEEIQQAFDSGANYVLCVGRIPSGFPLNKIFYEPLNFEEATCHFDFLGKICHSVAAIVWNQRNIITGNKKDVRIDQFIKIRDNSRGDYKICQASMIQTRKDVNPNVDFFIVGEHLPIFIDNR